MKFLLAVMVTTFCISNNAFACSMLQLGASAWEYSTLLEQVGIDLTNTDLEDASITSMTINQYKAAEIILLDNQGVSTKLNYIINWSDDDLSDGIDCSSPKAKKAN